MADELGFIEAARGLGKRVLSWKAVLVVHHLDCDGIASGGVAANALRAAGADLETLVLKRLDPQGAQQAASRASSKGANILFTDLGSGQLALLEPLLSDFEIAVADHHVPQKPLSHKNFVHANPMLFGYDGSYAASGASTAYFCFRDYCEGLEPLGIVGAVGDLQDAGGLSGLNKIMLDEGVRKGFVSAKRDLKMFGRHSRDLVSFLAYASEPYLPGLTGNLKNCASFLEDNGIPRQREGKWLRYKDLSGEEKKKLVSALANHLAEKKAEPEVIASLVGEVYEFPREDAETELFDSSEYGTLLNAVGRHGQARLGIGVCLHEPEALAKARGVLEKHRKLISNGINFAKNNCNDLGAFYLVDGRGVIEDTIVGSVVGSFFSSGLVPRTKPIIGFSTESAGVTKASGRASKELVEKGLDLNLLLRTAAESVGGLGGGHKIAAGASFPAGKESDFLLKCREVLKAQGF